MHFVSSLKFCLNLIHRCQFHRGQTIPPVKNPGTILRDCSKNIPYLVADSAQSTGVKWAAPAPTFVGVNAYRPGTSSTLTANTWYYVPLTAELYDTDSFHDNTTNNERFTIPSGKAGKYRISATARGEGGADYLFLYIFKNTGATELQPGLSGVIQRQNNMAGNNWGINASLTTDLAVGDYLRVGILVSTTTTNPLYCVFSAEWLGA